MTSKPHSHPVVILERDWKERDWEKGFHIREGYICERNIASDEDTHEMCLRDEGIFERSSHGGGIYEKITHGWEPHRTPSEKTRTQKMKQLAGGRKHPRAQ